MTRKTLDFHNYFITVVVPAYKVEREIGAVLAAMPAYVRRVVVVNDCSPDATAEVVARLAEEDERIILLNHDNNQGVGGAMLTGFQKALELGSQIVVKVDGDGQMHPEDIPLLLAPLVLGEADYAKGNRFRDFQALRQMPWIRRMGNMALSFLAKAATGYWNGFDPANVFLALRADVLRQLPLDKIDKSYFFEISLLSQLYLLGAYVRDVPMPARYKGEISSLSIRRVLAEFPGKLLGTFFRRLILKNFLYDFSMESLYLLFGVPLLLFGLIFGAYKWQYYARLGVGAPTGTIMLAMLSVMMGFQILLSATAIDLQSVPREPVCEGPLPEKKFPQGSPDEAARV